MKMMQNITWKYNNLLIYDVIHSTNRAFGISLYRPSLVFEWFEYLKEFNPSLAQFDLLIEQIRNVYENNDREYYFYLPEN